jgi:hypothetical protein
MVDSSQFGSLAKTIRLMLDIDPSLNDIELLYSHIQKDEALQKWVNLKFETPKRRIEELSRSFSKSALYQSSVGDIVGFIPPRWLVDSIPVPHYEPNIKKFSYDTEHAETLHQLKELKNEVFSLLNENGLRYQAKGNFGGEHLLSEAEKRFGYYKNNLLVVEGLLEKVINQATTEITESTPLADRYEIDRQESTDAAGQIRAARITRAILLRLCNEKALQMEVAFWIKNRKALSQVLESVYKSTTPKMAESLHAKAQQAEIAKGIMLNQMTFYIAPEGFKTVHRRSLGCLIHS